MFRVLHGGAVAQLGERVVRNDEVSGSIPLSSTIPAQQDRCNEGKLANYCVSPMRLLSDGPIGVDPPGLAITVEEMYQA